MAERVLAVSAHPADFCSRSGGTLIKHVRAGGQAKVIWLTHGEADESHLLYEQRPDISVEEVRQAREQEAMACIEVMGMEGHMFGYGDNPLRMTPERLEALAAQIDEYKPDILLTHWRKERSYPTHLMSSEAAVRATMMVKGTNDIRFFEPNIGTAARAGYIPDHYVDITDVFDQKIEALAKLTTQPKLLEMYTTCNRWRGIEAGCQYAEGFVRFAPARPLLQKLDA